MLVHVVAVRSIFQPLGACYGLLVNFLAIWYVVPRKIWQPWVHLGEIFWDQVADFFFLLCGGFSFFLGRSTAHRIQLDLTAAFDQHIRRQLTFPGKY
jgi:hypothetical protein